MNNKFELDNNDLNDISDIKRSSRTLFKPAIYNLKEETEIRECVEIAPNSFRNIVYHVPGTPTLDYEKQMWDKVDTFEKDVWSHKNLSVKTGFDMFDMAFDGGLKPGFVIVGGDSNLGKTAFVTQLLVGIDKNNDDVYTMDISLDDSLAEKMARVIACRSKIIMNAVKDPNSFKHLPLMLARRKQGVIDVRKDVGKYQMYTAKDFPGHYIEDIIVEIKKNKIMLDAEGKHRRLVVAIDSFHDLNVRKFSDNKYETLANLIGDLATDIDATIICTGELRKTIKQTDRPTSDDIREATKIKFKAKVIIMVYNEMHYKGGASKIYYKNSKNKKLPIFEADVCKNKFNDWKGRLFYEFIPEISSFKECNVGGVKYFNSLIEAV